MGDVLLMLMVWCGGVCALLFLAPAGPYSKRGPNIKEYCELSLALALGCAGMSCLVAVWCGVVACDVVWFDVGVVVCCVSSFLSSSRRRGPIQNEDPISRSIGNNSRNSRYFKEFKKT